MALRVRLSFSLALALGVAEVGYASETWQDWFAQGTALHNASRYTDAVQAFRQALKLAEGSGKDEHQTVRIHESLASTYADLGQTMEAINGYQRVLKLLEKLGERESLAYAFVLAEMVDFLGSNEVSPEMISTLRRAAATSVDADDQDKLSVVRISLASLYERDQKYKEAEPLLLDALNDLKKQNVVHPRSLIRVLNALAVLRFDQGRYSEALDLSTQWLQLSQVYYGREHPTVVLGLGNVGNALVRLGQLDAAATSYEQARSLASKVMTENDPIYVALLTNYSFTLRKLGRKQEAKLMAERSKQLQDTLNRMNGSNSTVNINALRPKQ